MSQENSMNFIKNIRPPKIAKRHPVAFSVAVILHIVVFVGLFFSNVQRWDEAEKQVKKTAPKFIPKAVTIDLSEIKREKQRLVDMQKKKAAKIKREERHLRVLEDERYKKQRKINQLKAKAKKEKQAKKLAENERKIADKKAKVAKDKRIKAEKEAKVAEKEAKVAERKRIKAEKKAKVAENKHIKTEKEAKVAEDKRIKAEKEAKAAEKKRIRAEKEAKAAENKRIKAEEESKIAEKKSKAELKKFKEEQAQRTRTEQDQLKDDARRKQVQERVLDELKAIYISQIASRVRNQWRYQGGKDDWGCEVHILQDTGGNVKNIDLKSCNVDNKSKEKSFKNAVKRAVNKASPLPAAPDKRVFDHKIIFNFRVN
ncbi:MAG: cell envelope integrity protein TolA [Gammaproteobacteria bacterium]|nr:cell envelope integrity protein TolA [Gammaproteobacteria bacterium]